MGRLLGIHKTTFNRKFCAGKTLWLLPDDLIRVWRDQDPDRRNAWRYHVQSVTRALEMAEASLNERLDRSSQSVDTYAKSFDHWQRLVGHTAILVEYLFDKLRLEHFQSWQCPPEDFRPFFEKLATRER